MTKYTEQIRSCYEYICSKSQEENPAVKLLKGGSYKIKQYYLENNNLDDIRGASVLLSYVEETVIPDMIKRKFSEDCIVYNGGGNIFCILPGDTDEDLCRELENEAQKYLVSANTAYVMVDARLDDIKNKYKDTVRMVEEKLADRKKLKIFNAINTESVFADSGAIPWENGDIHLNIKGSCSGDVCGLCKSKTAKYIIVDKGATYNVCASCLHKHNVGIDANRSKYVQEYEKRTGKKPSRENIISPNSSETVAVVYGDGNNMGQIIQNFNQITDMMEFSDFVKQASNDAVFEAMKQLDIQDFQIVGLGGDDVFVIVKGEDAVEFAVKVIEIYNSKFKNDNAGNGGNPYNSTMSVGICIAKAGTPIRVMLEIAEDKLSDAKEQAKRDNAENKDNGTISFAIINDPTASVENEVNKFGALSTLQPYSYDTIKEIIEFISVLKKKNMKTKLRNIYDAYQNGECIEEVDLFFKYLNVRSKDNQKIVLPKLKDYSLEKGMYTRTKGASDTEPARFIWKDIMELYDYVANKKGGEG